MAIATATGVPSYSGVLIPELWHGKWNVKFYDATLLAAIANTDYQGAISKQGDKVIIRNLPDIEIGDYVIGQSLPPSQRPVASTIELLIDKAKYFRFAIDDIDAVQTDMELMNSWMDDATQQSKIVIDTDILGGMVADVAAGNQGATAGVNSALFNLGTATASVGITTANAVDYLLALGTVLDEQNIPEQGRFVVLPPWFVNRLKRSELKQAYLTGDSVTPLRNGKVGMIDRFEVYSSNLQSTGTDNASKVYTNIIAGHKVATTFASQMTKMESIRAESSFAQQVRGLQVYGYKVVKPEALALLRAYAA
jgi:hypothetical protein